ncbi:unnamed protein product [Notodromas monacha]|uniref:Uncharacterized protein n=1 Tax=Notodromas monacha TaxID=399045 RepID=A0A7R9BS40_9CRUS|nr:unnamed protein product [Notodromas monacha]CAG0919295.1 unnamed protein product [Notodromas monacha]
MTAPLFASNNGVDQQLIKDSFQATILIAWLARGPNLDSNLLKWMHTCDGPRSAVMELIFTCLSEARTSGCDFRGREPFLNLSLLLLCPPMDCP